MCHQLRIPSFPGQCQPSAEGPHETRRTGNSADIQAGLMRCISVALVLTSFAPQGWGRDVHYVVQAGDNPWNISSRYLRSMDYWPRLQEYNAITIKSQTQLSIHTHTNTHSQRLRCAV